MTTKADDLRGPRERAYDEHFFPLVAELIRLSREHGVPFACTAILDNPSATVDGGALFCSTMTGDAPTTTEEENRRLGWAIRVFKDERFGHATKLRFTEYADDGYTPPMSMSMIVTKAEGV